MKLSALALSVWLLAGSSSVGAQSTPPTPQVPAKSVLQLRAGRWAIEFPSGFEIDKAPGAFTLRAKDPPAALWFMSTIDVDPGDDALDAFGLWLSSLLKSKITSRAPIAFSGQDGHVWTVEDSDKTPGERRRVAFVVESNLVLPIVVITRHDSDAKAWPAIQSMLERWRRLPVGSDLLSIGIDDMRIASTVEPRETPAPGVLFRRNGAPTDGGVLEPELRLSRTQSEIKIEDLRTFAESRLSKWTDLTEARIERSEALVVDGMKGWSLRGSARAASGEERFSFYLTVLHTEARQHYLVRGRAGGKAAAGFVADFDAMTRTMIRSKE